MRSAVVLGGTGSVGSACVAALQRAGWDVRTEPSPRLETSARTVAELTTEVSRHEPTIEQLADVLGATDVVVNAGGIATSSAAESDALFGANSLLPAVVSSSARRAGVGRVVHLSSVSVQGRRDPLDESMQQQANSPYSRSRALGELILQGADHDHTVSLRLPSVHGAGTLGNRRLNRIARSPFSSTAGRGDRPTPMVLPENVAAAVEFLASYEGDIPSIVLQPTEGLTTGRLLELLGDRKPHRVPAVLARSVTALLLLAGRFSPTVATLGRGLELMWLGQGQKQSWLTEAGFVPPAGVERWESALRAVRAS